MMLAMMPIFAYSESLYSNHIHEGYDEMAFAKTRTKALRMLQEHGYQVRNIELQPRMNAFILNIYALKNGVHYVLILSYPELRIIQEARIQEARIDA